MRFNLFNFFFIGMLWSLMKPKVLSFGKFSAALREDPCLAAAPVVSNTCPYNKSSQVSHLGFVKHSYNFTDINDPVEWASALGNSDVLIIPVADGKWASPEAIEVNGVGNTETMTIGYKWSIEAYALDPDLSMTMGQRLSKLNAYGVFTVFKGDNRAYGIITSDGANGTRYKNVSINAAPDFEDAHRRLKFSIKWTEQLMPLVIDVPANVITD